MNEQHTTQKAFTLEHLRGIVSKKKDATLDVKELEALFLIIEVNTDKEIRYQITKIFTYQLKQEKVNAFYILKKFLNKVFVQSDKSYLNILRNILIEVHYIRFTLPTTKNIIDFEINPEQLSWFFKDEKAFVNAYNQYLLSANDSLLSWLHYYFWKPFNEGWFQVLKNNKVQRKDIIQSWLHIAENATLQPTYRNYGIYALCLLKPLMSFWGRKRTQKSLRNLIIEDQCMHKALTAWEKM